MEIQKVLELLGYSVKEAKVYLAILNLGECHVSDIAEKVKMPRTSVQLIVDKLHRDGVINFYVMRRYKYWVAENPKRLLENIKKQEILIREALPELITLRDEKKGKRNKKSNIQDEIHFIILADSSSQPILITNDRPEILYVNDAWEQQFGYTLEEVKGKSPRILKSGKTPPEVYIEAWNRLKTGKLFQSDRIIDKRKDGTFFTLVTTIFPVHHKSKVYYIQILDDTSNKKRVENLYQQFSSSNK